MNKSLRVSMPAIVFLSLVACQSGMVPIPALYNQNIDPGLSQDQILKAIKVGAVSAGWRINELSDNEMLATYQIRSHTIIVTIDYSADGYGIKYKSSIQMKVRCGEYDATQAAKVTTGQSPCPGGAPPTFIHQNYKVWVDGLNGSIQAALQDI